MLDSIEDLIDEVRPYLAQYPALNVLVYLFFKVVVPQVLKRFSAKRNLKIVEPQKQNNG